MYRDDKPGWEWDHFQTTPPMSTYSVGFLVADFKHEINEEDSFGVSIWGLNSDIIYGHPVLDYSITLLRTLRTKLGIGYPLPKLDIVIVPKYAVSIMDSWGLVFWQRDFLMQSAMSLVGFNPEFMDLVADQIVRQIFGNVVTIKSWRDLWFAEGFHMYLSQLLVDSSMVGRVQLFRSDITDDIISVFSSDSLEYTQAVSYNGEQWKIFIFTVI